jgi:hypothetical protein
MSLPEKHYSKTCIDKETVKTLLDTINNYSVAVINLSKYIRGVAPAHILTTALDELDSENNKIQDLLVSFHDIYMRD